jgi:hypothetical protein
MKSPLASTIASIRDRNVWQGWMTTSLSISVSISEILALREDRDVMRVFIDLSLNFAPHEII